MPILKFKSDIEDRIDRVIAHGAEGAHVTLSRRASKELVDAGRVKVDGHIIKRSSHTVKVGSTVEVNYDEPSRPDHVDLSDRILYEDRWVLAINKPAGLPSQSTRDLSRDHAVAAVERYLKSKVEGAVKVALHHRLDVDTSGVLIFGIHKDANKGLTEAFRNRKTQKVYLAVVSSPVPDSFEVENHLAADSKGYKTRMKSVASGGDLAKTSFRVLAKLGSLSLVEARPATGRMHQIRVHLSEYGAPILGDTFYGGASLVDGFKAPRTLLHAWKLELPHPVEKRRLAIESPWPEDFPVFVVAES
jgi:23S rRNA pseudouridine1911/1915/1917 synthase